MGSFADDQQSYDALKGVSLRGVRSLEQFEMVCTEQNLLVPRRNKEFDLSNLQSKQVPQILYELASEIARAYNFPEPPCFSKNNKTLLDWSW